MRVLLTRIGLIVLGLVLGLAVLEVGLQVGAAWVWARGDGGPTAWLTGNRRVLCLGDSNTYGLYLEDRSKAYPQQLESFWNSGNRRRQIEVLNFGYPGTNSSRLRRDLPHMLATLRPEVVIVLIGANDGWTAPVAIDDSPDFSTRISRFIRARSRVYQLVYMLGRASNASGVVELDTGMKRKNDNSGTIRFGDAEFAMGWKRGASHSAFGADLEKNLAAINELCRQFGAELILLTYASEEWNYGAANRHIRKAAADTGTLLVDAVPIMRKVCPSEPCPAYLYHDHHPTERGYRIVALATMRALARGDAAVAAAMERK